MTGARTNVLLGLLLCAWGAGLWSSARAAERVRRMAATPWAEGRYEAVRPLVADLGRVALVTDRSRGERKTRLFHLQYAVTPAAVHTRGPTGPLHDWLRDGHGVVVDVHAPANLDVLLARLAQDDGAQAPRFAVHRIGQGLAVLRPTP